jgi:tetratricopeptide (TPR) repeat protein
MAPFGPLGESGSIPAASMTDIAQTDARWTYDRMAMAPEELLGLARGGDLDALSADRPAVADAVGAFVAAGDPASALELVGRAWRIWFSRGELDEGSAVTATALGAPDAEAVPFWRVRVLYADGLFAFRSGDQRRSRARNEEALWVARETDDVRGECDALTGLARVALRDGRYGQVVALARQARERAEAAGDREAEASPLHLHAAGVRLQRKYKAARELYLESLDLNAALGHTTWVAMEHHNLGWVELHLGNVDEAEARFRQRDTQAADDAYGNAWSNLNWAAVAAARGDVEEVKRRFATGTHALKELGVALDPDDQSELDWLTRRVGHDRR